MLKSVRTLVALMLTFVSVLLVPSSTFALTSQAIIQHRQEVGFKQDFNRAIKNSQRNNQINAFALLSLANHKPDELIVKFKDYTSQEAEQRTLGNAQLLKKSKATGISRIKLPLGTDLAKEINRLRNSGVVEFVEPNYTTEASMIPNDQYYSQQWALAKINAPSAWNITQGSSSITVAVLDSGVDSYHPDLAANILPGYNFIAGTTDTYDDNGHGTFVSGIIAGLTNNNVGIAGLAGKVKILPLKVLDAQGSGTYYDEINAIEYAVNSGAKVINLSLGGPGWSSGMFNAILYAYDHGVTVVAAAGNDGNSTYNYPASYPCVISTGSIDSSDTKSAFSNFNEGVDLVAAGESIISTFPTLDGSYAQGDGYTQGDGTSFSTPYVAGLAALLLSIHPSATPGQIEQYMKDSAVDLAAIGRDNLTGWGRIDAYKALTTTLQNGDSFEPNYSASSAKAISSGTYSPTVYPAQDIDTFKVSAQAGEQLKVTITPPADLDPMITIYDFNGNAIASADSSFMGGIEQTSATIPTSGTYYIDVTDANAASSKQPYKMEVAIANPLYLTVTSPTNGLITKSNLITVSGNATPGSSVKANGYSVTLDASGNFSTTIPLAVGSNTITVTATNSFGTTTVTRTVTYDNVAPNLTVTTPLDNFVTIQSSVAVTGTAELGSTVKVNGSAVALDSYGNYNQTVALKAGANTITVTATDTAGNVKTVVRKVVDTYNTTAIWNLSSNGSTLAPSLGWYSTPNGFPWLNCKETLGDFNGDGKKDVAVLYNYGNNTAGIWKFLSNGSSYTASLAWKSAAGAFSWTNSKVTAGDVNSDGKDDLIVLYNYGSNTSGLWTFISNGTSFTPKIAWKSSPGTFSWDQSKLIAGDFNCDAKEDVQILYNFGSNTTGIYNFISNGSTLTQNLTWKSNPGGFSWEKSKITRADINGDGKDDVALLYDYGLNTTGIWNFVSTGIAYTPKLSWKSGTGAFSWANSKLVATDINGDRNDDIAILYNNGSSTSSLWSFISNGTSLAPKLAWKSAAGTFSWDKSLLLGGDFNGDKKGDIEVFYTYSN
jgi:subtilisin family serine protease